MDKHAAATSEAGTALYEVDLIDAIDKVPANTWNALMHDSNPFNQHQYLAALESSGCVGSQSGWTPLHVIIRETTTDESRRVIAVMPLYIKSHSYGEYVFDWAWAEAYERHQLPYYPKLVSAIPFTPVTGMRLGVAKDASIEAQQALWQLINQTLNNCLSEYGFSGWHCLFLPQSQFTDFSKQGNLQRLGTQFHWFNREYDDFQAFLQSLTSRKRKDINKERQKLSPLGLSFEFIEGEQISADLWKMFYRCYQQTYAKRSGHYGYLNLAFFEALAKTMPESIVLLVVRNQDRECIASALYFKTETHLYGRYWGCLVEVDGLHFETCYYQGIAYCIANKLQVFDAGAQGEHKVPRGFEPVETFSNHEICHNEFRQAIDRFTRQEAENTKIYMQQLKSKLPYKNRA
ncbi:GNAT family N-acetyltransferase [Shewanella sp. 125m-1]